MTAPAHERAPDVPALAEPVITVTGLTKRYGRVTALDEVSCTVTGGITGLLGANGAGKSTLIKILLGLVEPDSGTATVLGYDVARHGLRAREHIGYMPEHDCLPADVSAAEFVAHMAQLSGLPPRQAWTRAADTLRYVGLDEERYRPIGGYSTGMRQRVKFAVALVHDPRLLLLDEPTNGLDPAGREQMLELIRRTGRGQGMAILMATHLLADVERVCDHVLVLDGGRLARAGPLTSFRSVQPLLRVAVGPADAPRLAAALAGQGEDVRVHGGEVLVALRDYAVYDRIRDTVAALDLPLLRLGQVTSTLADIFAEEA
jgi:ABC-2 type transport system ATP-binding protein